MLEGLTFSYGRHKIKEDISVEHKVSYRWKTGNAELQGVIILCQGGILFKEHFE